MQLVVSDACDIAKALINVPGGYAVAIRSMDGVAGTAMDDVCGFIRQFAAFHEVADAIAEQRHVIVRERGHDEVSDTAGVGRNDFEIGVVVTGLHLPLPRLHHEMASFGRAVEVEDGHAKSTFDNPPVNRTCFW